MLENKNPEKLDEAEDKAEGSGDGSSGAESGLDNIAPKLSPNENKNETSTTSHERKALAALACLVAGVAGWYTILPSLNIMIDPLFHLSAAHFATAAMIGNGCLLAVSFALLFFAKSESNAFLKAFSLITIVISLFNLIAYGTQSMSFAAIIATHVQATGMLATLLPFLLNPLFLGLIVGLGAGAISSYQANKAAKQAEAAQQEQAAEPEQAKAAKQAEAAQQEQTAEQAEVVQQAAAAELEQEQVARKVQSLWRRKKGHQLLKTIRAATAADKAVTDRIKELKTYIQEKTNEKKGGARKSKLGAAIKVSLEKIQAKIDDGTITKEAALRALLILDSACTKDLDNVRETHLPAFEESIGLSPDQQTPKKRLSRLRSASQTVTETFMNEADTQLLKTAAAADLKAQQQQTNPVATPARSTAQRAAVESSGSDSDTPLSPSGEEAQQAAAGSAPSTPPPSPLETKTQQEQRQESSDPLPSLALDPSLLAAANATPPSAASTPDSPVATKRSLSLG